MRGKVVLGSAIGIALAVLGSGKVAADVPYDRKLEQAVMAIMARKEWKLREGFAMKDRLILVQFERPGNQAVVSSFVALGTAGASSSTFAGDTNPIVQLMRS